MFNKSFFLIVLFSSSVSFNFAFAETKAQFSKQAGGKKLQTVDLINESLESKISNEVAIQEVVESQKLQVGVFFSALQPRFLKVNSNNFIKNYNFTNSVPMVGIDYKNYSLFKRFDAPDWGGRFSLSYGNLQEMNGEPTRLHLAPIQMSLGKRVPFKGLSFSFGIGHSEMIFVQKGIDEMNFSGRSGYQYFEAQVSQVQATGSRMNMEWSAFFQQNLTSQTKNQDFRGQNIGLGVSFIL